MSNYQIVTNEEFSKLRWKKYENYLFAEKDIIASLVLEELPKACLSMPIVFCKEGENFSPAALLGLKPGKNLYVSRDGRWLGSYIPAVYRSYPFALARINDNKTVLCVDSESGLVGENFDQTFFDESGEPSNTIKEVLQFLTQIWNSRLFTVQLCKALEAEGLIIPWRLKIRDEKGEQSIEGLFRIDEDKLRGLSAEALFNLHQKEALTTIYCHLISLQNIQTLVKLSELHSKLERSKMPLTDKNELDLSFLTDTGNIKF